MIAAQNLDNTRPPKIYLCILPAHRTHHLSLIQVGVVLAPFLPLSMSLSPSSSFVINVTVASLWCYNRKLWVQVLEE